MSTLLAASTVTPGSTAPEVSRTRPAMVACAKAVDGTSAAPRATPRNHANNLGRLRIRLPPFEGLWHQFRHTKMVGELITPLGEEDKANLEHVGGWAGG